MMPREGRSLQLTQLNVGFESGLAQCLSLRKATFGLKTNSVGVFQKLRHLRNLMALQLSAKHIFIITVVFVIVTIIIIIIICYHLLNVYYVFYKLFALNFKTGKPSRGLGASITWVCILLCCLDKNRNLSEVLGVLICKMGPIGTLSQNDCGVA